MLVEHFEARRIHRQEVIEHGTADFTGALTAVFTVAFTGLSDDCRVWRVAKLLTSSNAPQRSKFGEDRREEMRERRIEK